MLADRKMKTNRRGQLFSGDIAMATAVFLVSLSTAFLLWNSVSGDLERSENLRLLSKLASESIEQLVRTPGLPEDWSYGMAIADPTVLKSLGLATTDRVINETKAYEFIQLMNSTNYDDYRHLMGLGIYHFQLNVTDLNGTAIEVRGLRFSVGEPLSDYTEAVSMFRTAIYDDEIVRLTYVVWR